MKDKPEYRSFYSRIVDDVDFQEMAGDVFKVLFALKHSLGAAGIGILRKLILAEQVGLGLEQLEAALVELEKPKGYGGRGWIVREKNIVWIVNALANEPNLSHDNPKHRTFVEERLLKPLGDAPIVRQFRAHYAAWFGESEPGPRPPASTIDTHSDRVSDTVGDTVPRDRVSGGYGHHEATRDEATRTESREPKSETSDAARFLDRFYPDAGDRRTAVARQLKATLNSEGARLSRGVRVTAKNLKHLERCCAAVIADPPDNPDVAVVWVLKKLQDEEKNDRGQYPAEVAVDRDKKLIAQENAYARELRDAAKTWAEQHPEQLADLTAKAEHQFPGEGAFHATARGSWIVQEISKRISFPAFETWLAGEAAVA